jgi:hypothetical protein
LIKKAVAKPVLLGISMGEGGAVVPAETVDCDEVDGFGVEWGRWW